MERQTNRQTRLIITLPYYGWWWFRCIEPRLSIDRRLSMSMTLPVSWFCSLKFLSDQPATFLSNVNTCIQRTYVHKIHHSKAWWNYKQTITTNVFAPWQRVKSEPHQRHSYRRGLYHSAPPKCVRIWCTVSPRSENLR